MNTFKFGFVSGLLSAVLIVLAVIAAEGLLSTPVAQAGALPLDYPGAFKQELIAAKEVQMYDHMGNMYSLIVLNTDWPWIQVKSKLDPPKQRTEFWVNAESYPATWRF